MSHKPKLELITGNSQDKLLRDPRNSMYPDIVDVYIYLNSDDKPKFAPCFLQDRTKLTANLSGLEEVFLSGTQTIQIQDGPTYHLIQDKVHVSIKKSFLDKKEIKPIRHIEYRLDQYK